MSQLQTNAEQVKLVQSGSILAALQRRPGTLSLLLVAVTLAFYNPIVRNHFIDFDDSAYIVENRQVLTGLTWGTVKWSLTTFREGIWHPLTWCSHALDCQLFHLNPIGHHYMNLLLHTANGVLLFLLLRRATGFTWLSLLVAALFALHPINVESVAWAAERKNVLSMLFFLLALHAYEGYARTSRRMFYVAVALLFSLGLLAKPQIVTLPFVLLLWDYWPLERMAVPAVDSAARPAPGPRSFWFLVQEKTPLFILAAADSFVTVVAQQSRNSVRSLADVSLSARLENVFVSYVRYLGKALWPSHLVPMYPHPGDSLPLWQVVGAAAVLVALSVLILRCCDRRYLVMGWLWFLGALVPMIGIITVGEQAMADRYAYLPFIGLWIALAWGAGELASKQRISAGWLAGLALLVLVVLGALTSLQLGHWFDDETLWRYTLNVDQRNYEAHDSLALALAKKGRKDEAAVHFQAARALHKYPPDKILRLAVYELRLGLPQEALLDSRAALQASSDPRVLEAAFSQAGLALLQLRRYDEAAESYRNALRFGPENGDALIGSGILALRSRDFGLAVAQFSHAARVAPSGMSFLLLSEALRQNGEPAEADLAAGQARKLSSNFIQAKADVSVFLDWAGLKPL